MPIDSTFVTLKNVSAESLLAMAVTFGWRLLSAMLVLLVGYIIIRVLLSVLRGTLKRTVADATVRQYVTSAARILLFIILVSVLLGVFGVATTSLAAIVGAAGLAVGLALQGSLSNFAAGFMLLVFRPFKAGDQIEVAGVSGTVIEIGIFSTIIDLPDNIRAFVPNGSIFTGVIKNKSIHEYLRVETKVTVSPDADITRVQQIIQRLLVANDLVMEIPRPEVQVVEDESPGISIAVRPYAKLKDCEAVRTTVAKQVQEALREAGVEVLKQ
jgi:small conductance mechanosensitive channel